MVNFCRHLWHLRLTLSPALWVRQLSVPLLMTKLASWRFSTISERNQRVINKIKIKNCPESCGSLKHSLLKWIAADTSKSIAILCPKCGGNTKAIPWLAYSAGVGVTKPISSVPLFSEIFNIVKTHIMYWISCLYLAGVAAAQLRWHLPNMNMIQRT